jgi:hypothetical protein
MLVKPSNQKESRSSRSGHIKALLAVQIAHAGAALSSGMMSRTDITMMSRTITIEMSNHN